jgi:hypothetical protein
VISTLTAASGLPTDGQPTDPRSEVDEYALASGRHVWRWIVADALVRAVAPA